MKSDAQVEEVPQSVEPAPGVPRRRSILSGRRLMWLILALALVSLPFFSQPGRYVADTRDATWFAPGTDLSQQLTLWKSSPMLGVEQHTGTLVPMGVVVGLLRGAGLPVWVAERLWHGLLLFVSAAGMVFLLDRLRGRRTIIAPVSAALIYTLTPYTFGYGLPTSAAFLPYVLLPALMYITVRWLPERGLAGPALVGLASFLMGGGNGAPQVYSFIPVVAFMAWAVWIERAVPLRQAARFAGWSLLFVVALNAYWIFALSSSSDVSNVLALSEQPRVINVASSFSETIRGLGFWGFYGWDQSGAWVPTVQRFITSPLLIILGFAVPVGAVLSAWLVRWRYRLFFLFLAILAVVVMAGIFPVKSPTPFGHLLDVAFRRVRVLAGLRTTYKFGPTLALALAVLAAVGLEALWERVATLEWAGAGRLAVAVLALVALLAAATPLRSGQLYASSRTTRGIPSYWTSALAWLRGTNRGYRAFFAPSAAAPAYAWGRLHDGIPEATPWLDSVHPARVPVGEHYGSNLLAAIEQPYQQDTRSQNAATLFRYLGINQVVLQNDLRWEESGAARPAEVQTLARDPSLGRPRPFGPPGAGIVPRAEATRGQPAPTAEERRLAPIEILPVPNPAPVVHADFLHPVVISGDGFGLASAARDGLLDGDPPVLYSGALSPAQLATLAGDDPSFVITDSNRRRAWTQGGVRHNFSYTLPAGQTLPGLIAYGLFGGRTDAQSVAVYEGVRSITASAYGSIFRQIPTARPANAFDGDLKTAWEVGAFGNPVGSWITVAFTGPRTLSEVSLTEPPLPFPGTRQVTLARLEFSDGSSWLTTVHPGTTEVSFPARETSFLRVRIAAVSASELDTAVGFSEITFPGLKVREVVQVPHDLIDTIGATPRGRSLLAEASLTYLFDRARTDAPFQQDEETGILRRFEVPALRSFGLDGTLHLDTVSDDQVDALLRGPTDVTATSSSRYFGAATLRASNAIDGVEKTAWIPQGRVGQWIKLTFPPETLSHLAIQTAVGLGRVRITRLRVNFSDGSVDAGTVDQSGRLDLTFPPRRVSSVIVTIGDVARGPSANGPVGISEIEIRGVRLPPLRSSSLLGCFPAMAIDGAPTSIRPEGTLGQLLAGGQLAFSTCHHEELTLGAGWHEIDARGALQPDTIKLASPEAASLERPVSPPELATSAVGAGYDVDVRGASAPFYLSIGQNYSNGWTASIDGASLGRPILLDGYSAGWRIDRPGSYRVSVRYGPQRRYDVSLGISALSLLVVLGVLAAPAVPRRRTRAGPKLRSGWPRARLRLRLPRLARLRRVRLPRRRTPSP